MFFPVASPSCDNGQTLPADHLELRGQYFHFPSSGLKYIDAVMLCQNMGADLFRPRNPEELKTFKILTRNNRIITKKPYELLNWLFHSINSGIVGTQLLVPMHKSEKIGCQESGISCLPYMTWSNGDLFSDDPLDVELYSNIARYRCNQWKFDSDRITGILCLSLIHI